MKSLLSVILLGLMVITFTEYTNALDPVTVSMLVKHGQELAAPFTKSSFGRLHSTIFGKGRGARTSDVIVFNSSGKNFRLSSSSCAWGGFSSGMFPEYKLPIHKTIMFGIESNGFMTGVDCKVKYKARDGTWFEMDVRNPYWSQNRATQSHSYKLQVIPILGKGNNNHVQYEISDA